jgi:hypothetical protein
VKNLEPGVREFSMKAICGLIRPADEVMVPLPTECLRIRHTLAYITQFLGRDEEGAYVAGENVMVVGLGVSGHCQPLTGARLVRECGSRQLAGAL